jgi:outer membrane immunogenic protein
MRLPLLARAFARLLVVFCIVPAQAADMALKAPIIAPPPIWSGFYIGGVIGYGFENGSVTSTPNDPASALLLNGTLGFRGEQPVASSFVANRNGVVGGFEAGYNWQVSPRWLLGLETDISGSGIRGQASGTSIAQGPPAATVSQTLAAQQNTDWYGTARGRVGFLATPNLLLFGTGGLAYGGVRDTANFTDTGPAGLRVLVARGGFSFACTTNATCFSGSGSTTLVGWTAGGGLEWLFDRHWSAKIEYQFVGLGTDTFRVTALATAPRVPTPASFNTSFQDGFSVVRAGVNYHF